jgi:hypothetical protein
MPSAGIFWYYAVDADFTRGSAIFLQIITISDLITIQKINAIFLEGGKNSKTKISKALVKII